MKEKEDTGCPYCGVYFGDEPQPDEDEIERDKISKSNAIGLGLIPPDQSSRLLTEKEQDACTPKKEQMEAYLAEPDDEVAAILRAENPEKFRQVARAILYGKNIAKAQLAKDDTRKEASIEEILRLSPIDNSNLIADRWIDLESGFKQAQSRIVKLFKATLCKANPTSEVEG